MYKYSGKEQPQTTISRGSKYVAAPKSATTLVTQESRENTCMSERLCEDGDCSSSIEKDVQVHLKPRWGNVLCPAEDSIM